MEHKVLVIDDEPDICEMIAETIQPLASTVFSAHDVPQALQVIEKQKIDLIISDIMMPGMTGIELLKLLRQKRLTIPLVFISASDSEESMVKALEFGAADFISKPFETDEVFNLVKRLLGTVKALKD